MYKFSHNFTNLHPFIQLIFFYKHAQSIKGKEIVLNLHFVSQGTEKF